MAMFSKGKETLRVCDERYHFRNNIRGVGHCVDDWIYPEESLDRTLGE